MEIFKTLPLSFLEKLKSKEAGREYMELPEGKELKLTSDRYPVLQQTQVCSKCGTAGTHLSVDIHYQAEMVGERYHINLRGEDDLLFCVKHKSKQLVCEKCL